MQTKPPSSHNTPTFTLARTYDAPRGLVWRAFSEAERLARWWGPKDLEWIKGDLDLRAGGSFHYAMRVPGGDIMWGKFVYREIAPPERIVWVNSFSDEDANVTSSDFAPGWPLEILNTIVLTEKGNKTLVELFSSPINASAEECSLFEEGFASMEQGWGGTFDQLEDYLRTEK